METTPERVVVPDGTVVDILTGKMEHHISADVAYAVSQYWRATGDDDFFAACSHSAAGETAKRRLTVGSLLLPDASTLGPRPRRRGAARRFSRRLVFSATRRARNQWRPRRPLLGA